jgi:hypothetical protein
MSGQDIQCQNAKEFTVAQMEMMKFHKVDAEQGEDGDWQDIIVHDEGMSGSESDKLQEAAQDEALGGSGFYANINGEYVNLMNLYGQTKYQAAFTGLKEANASSLSGVTSEAEMKAQVKKTFQNMS